MEDLLDAALAALRQGQLAALVAARPLVARWMMRRHLPLLRGAIGDAPGHHHELPQAAECLLKWLVSQLRPDQAPSLDVQETGAWLDQVSWRPMLSVMCHYGLAAVPEFRERYRRRVGELPIDNLCGLWNVGPSTFYRYLERGKRHMALVAVETTGRAARSLSLRAFAVSQLAAVTAAREGVGSAGWHQRQAQWQRQQREPLSALWHAVQARDGGLAASLLQAHAPVLAGEAETDALVERLSILLGTGTGRFELLMARAALARVRDTPERERQAHDQALQVATETGNALHLGMVYGAMGRFYESRDSDRAFACYEDSARCLLEADPGHQEPKVLQHYATTLVRQAWMHVLRNHPRAKDLLEQAESLRHSHGLADELLGMLEQTWGEYWRIAGDLGRAMDAKHRALNIFERLSDRRSVLATFLNLILLHGQAREIDRALDYGQRFFDAARLAVIEPEMVINAHLNLGTAQVWAARYDLAIDEYLTALRLALASDLRRHANLSRFNLASAYFRRFVETGQAEFESLGDEQLQAFLRAPPGEVIPSWVEDAKTMKAEILAEAPERPIDQLLDVEAATHLHEMAEIERQRAVLAGAGGPQAHARAHLAIAKAYLAVAAKEREAARALIDGHGLQKALSDEFDELRVTFQRELSREQQLAGPWKQAAADLMDDARRAALIAHLLREGAVNKSGYAELCGVAPATASKHLALLTERGLLQQTGKGPSTRYRLA